MKTITRKYKVYEFDELSEDAKNKAIDDEINFYINAIPYEDMSSDMKRAVDKSESMFTPWFVGSYLLDYCKNEIIESIKLNDYTFTKEGKLANY